MPSSKSKDHRRSERPFARLSCESPSPSRCCYPRAGRGRGRDRHKSDVEDVKEDIDNAKKGLDSAGKLKMADKNDVKKAGKDRAKEEVGDRPILPES